MARRLSRGFKIFSQDYIDDVRSHPRSYLANERPVDDLDRSPRCRCCGKPLELGEICVTWLHDPGGALYWRYYAYVHKDCPAA